MIHIQTTLVVSFKYVQANVTIDDDGVSGFWCCINLSIDANISDSPDEEESVFLRNVDI
jgi:hypothetical protein